MLAVVAVESHASSGCRDLVVVMYKADNCKRFIPFTDFYGMFLSWISHASPGFRDLV